MKGLLGGLAWAGGAEWSLSISEGIMCNRKKMIIKKACKFMGDAYHRSSSRMTGKQRCRN